MTNVDFTQIELEHLITHYVGSKLREQEVKLSKKLSAVDASSENYLLRYLILPIKTEEFYHFHHSVSIEMNEVYKIISDIFSEPNDIIQHSQSLAKLLYNCTTHPKVNEGKLNVAHFSNIEIENELVNAIGIFKSETDAPFIKMEETEDAFAITHDFGFELKGIDKACLVFNTAKDTGYKVLLVDPAKGNSDARYWKDEFLQVEPISDEFHQTNQVMGLTKRFVTEQIVEDVNITRTEQIDLLNRAAGYFKENETFEKEKFEEEVLQEEPIINSFRTYNDDYKQAHNIEIADSFEISAPAVKKQARVFKSVLKLDKNFHVYIHGNKNMIEQGKEADGRKYYKLYFEEEK
jgi:hypothetical protein